jgi:hypothetical protein
MSWLWRRATAEIFSDFSTCRSLFRIRCWFVMKKMCHSRSATRSASALGRPKTAGTGSDPVASTSRKARRANTTRILSDVAASAVSGFW